MMDELEEENENALDPDGLPVSPFTLPKEFENSVGKIIRVTLINFLNHANLVIECSPNVNMIFGLNGQGKSAIVQGIALCLGGYGHSVGRDASLKQYIKDYHLRDGPPYAKIEILLSNHGEGSYKHDVFGDTIILSRLIKRNVGSSGSTFYMLGPNSKSKSIRQKDLKGYLRHIRLNIGNPTTYMDQESCKSFFFQSNPENIYRYYSAAAGLIEMEDNINLEKKNLEECRAELKLRKNVLAPDRDKLKDLSKQIRIFEEKLNEWKSAKQMYKLSLYKADKEKYETLKEAHKIHSLSDPKAEIERLKESISLYTSEQVDMKSDMENLSGSTLKLKESINSIVDKISILDEGINDIKSRIAAKNTSISHIETAMVKLKEEWEKSASEPKDIEKHRLENELQQCHKEFEEIHSRHKAIASAITNVESNIAEIELQIKDAKKELEEQRKENSTTRASQKRRAAAGGRSALYHYEADQVRKDIRHMKSLCLFKYEPIGPIGDYLFVIRDIPTARVLGVVEHHLKNMLHTWLVATESDRHALETLLIKHGCSKGQVKIIKTNVFACPDLAESFLSQQQKVDDPCTIMDYLATEEIPAILLYVLEDNCGISRAFICSDDREVYKKVNDVTIESSVVYSLTTLNSGRRVNGCIHMTQFHDRHPFSYEYVRQTKGYNNFNSSDINDSTRISAERESSLSSMIEGLTKELDECKSTLKVHKRKLESVRQEKTGIIRKRTRLEADLNEETDNLLANDESLSHSRYCESLEAIQSDYRKQLRELSTELIALEKELESKESQKSGLVAEQGTTNDSLKAMLKNISSRKVDMNRVQQHIQSQKSKIKALESNVGDHQTKLRAYESDIESLEQKIRTHEEEMTAEGIDFSGKLPTRSPETYLKIINLSNDMLVRIADDSINMEKHLEVLREKYSDAEAVLADKELRLKETTENYKTQKRNYIKRCKRFEACRARIERKAKRAFRQTLDAVTGYDGNLIFNDINKTLDIQIHNKQQSYSRVHVATDLKTLSGGEQSSIQLTMLQSLAAISYSPVHMFDEVDVYMDESVRVKNIESLVRFATKHEDRQFFLVTPHSELAKHIKDSFSDVTRIFNVAKDK